MTTTPTAAATSSTPLPPDLTDLLPTFPSLNEAQPAILTFDSLTSYHKSEKVAEIFRIWIVAEWCARRNGGQPVGGVAGSLSQASLKRLIPTIAIPAPRQDNSCDCGVFLLRYAESVMRFVAHRQAGGDLLGAVLQEKFSLCRRPDCRGDARGIAAVAGTHLR